MPASLASSRDDPGGDPVVLGDLIGFHLRLATTRMMNDLRPALANLELRPVLFAILELVRVNPGIIQMRIGDELGVQRANLVPLINELMKRGAIKRKIAKHDKRAYSLYLTATGELLHDRAKRVVLEHEERILKRLNATDRNKLRRLLDEVAVD